MPPSFPLPTLAAKIGPDGITAPSYADILQSLVASAKSIFGSDIYLEPDAQDYQILAIFAMAINDGNQTMIAAVSSLSPSFAQGALLSSLVKINGLQREVATNSTAIVTLIGVAGTVITGGKVQDTSENLWDLPATVTIPVSGTVDVTATCETIGAVLALPNTITSIYTVVRGWQSVTNAAAAVSGAPVESDAALRRRQAQSTAIAAITPLSSILAAVANVPGVIRYAIYENDTNTTDSNGIPSHSIAVVVQGGNITAVAQVIAQKKSPGTGTYGSTSQTVLDPAGLPVTIRFFELANVTVYVSLTIQPLTGYVASTGDALIAAIVDFVNALDIGEEVFFNWLWGPASLYGSPLGSTYRVTSMTIGTGPSPVGTSDIPVAFNLAASCGPANVVLTTI